MANPVKTALAVGACKAVRSALRTLHRGGTTTPGKVAMKIDGNILSTVSTGMDIIVVTGTNGKTTTSNMIEHALTSAGYDVLANKSGANLLPGVTAEFTSSASFFGKPKKRYAVIECDEGALKQVVPKIRPKVIVVTNLFRDQLDRYGEVMHTRDEIRKGIDLVPEAVLCLNADDSLVASLALDAPNPVVYYGLDTPVGDQDNVEISDARYCIRCGTEYEYSYHTYAHLGGFSCPKCGYRRMNTEVAVEQIKKSSSRGMEVEMRLGTEKRDVTVGLPAVYNLYNAVAAICAYRTAGFETEQIIGSLADVSSSFGRMETFDLDGVPVQMILVKNPAGCNQALSYLAGLGEDYQAVFCLNDRTADGHDISWIWDADFEMVCQDPHLKHAYVMGDRAEDMQLRLKYGDASEVDIEIAANNDVLIEKMRKSEVPVFILPNYTSMLSLRAALGAVTGKAEFWKG
uniref:Lipid II isoglutaminyl synthase (glutamine-hydrolyzing) subunit MurT n=1 Tax=Eubacterium cellulosolvens (strain ATCC 43171 / JCM 9499 / 6) TaxID=633697 RepID=I5AVB2_EUBC6